MPPDPGWYSDPSSFDGVLAKVERAEEHVDTIGRAISAWALENPEPFTHHHSTDKTEHRIHFTPRTEPDLTRWAVIAGECVHALRSALDHCMWIAAQAEGLAHSRSREFPVFLDRAVYDRDVERKFDGVQDPEVLGVVERVQPWQRGPDAKDDHLWIVHELDRIDKHRTLTVVPMVPRTVDFEGTFHGVGEDAAPPAVVGEGRPLKKDAVFLTFYSPTPPEKVEMNLRIGIGIGLEWDGVVRGGVTGTLNNLCAYVRQVVEELRETIDRAR
jgi:hypothetical protein